MRHLIHLGVWTLFLATLAMGMAGCGGKYQKSSSYEETKSTYEKDTHEKRREGSGY